MWREGRQRERSSTQCQAWGSGADSREGECGSLSVWEQRKGRVEVSSLRVGGEKCRQTVLERVWAWVVEWDRQQGRWSRHGAVDGGSRHRVWRWVN